MPIKVFYGKLILSMGKEGEDGQREGGTEEQEFFTREDEKWKEEKKKGSQRGYRKESLT